MVGGQVREGHGEDGQPRSQDWAPRTGQEELQGDQSLLANSWFVVDQLAPLQCGRPSEKKNCTVRVMDGEGLIGSVVLVFNLFMTCKRVVVV